MSKPDLCAALTVETGLEAICLRLSEASAVARAALTCAQAGASERAVEMALFLEEPVREAKTLPMPSACSSEDRRFSAKIQSCGGLSILLPLVMCRWGACGRGSLAVTT